MEWSLVAGVIAVLAFLFLREMRVLQGQSELAAVKTTLGALRTAFVIDHLQKNIAAAKSITTVTQRNPFELLQRRPVNYAGEMHPTQSITPQPGTWVFDSDCSCIGYLPIYDQWFDSPNGDTMAWFQVIGALGPLQLRARESYVWQGQVMN